MYQGGVPFVPLGVGSQSHGLNKSIWDPISKVTNIKGANLKFLSVGVTHWVAESSQIPIVASITRVIKTHR